MKRINLLLSIVAAAAFISAPAFVARAHEGHDHSDADEATETTTVKGEVIDLACYIDHGATGEKHADCARKCIASGLPTGIKTEDGKVYMLIGAHKPMNKELAQYAAKTI